ncbi:hypothetical protein Q1695_013551 [Nippostrongylus brasiliensis]|nr:hypothetical protein Q1695_013551 [Nippostrongylus brasiliensis]
MVAVRLLVLLAALAIVGEAAKYDIFDVIEKLTTLTKQDIIDRIKASEQASRLGVKNDDVIRLNGPLWSKFQTLRARLQTMTRAEQTVVRTLFSIARDVIDRRVSDAAVSDRIVEAFQNGGQGLCARYKRLPGELCSLTSPTAQPTIPGGHPAPTRPSASSDGNVMALFVALMDAARTNIAIVQDPFKDSLNEAVKYRDGLTEDGFKKIAGKIRDDIAKVKQIFGIVRKPVGPTIGLFTQFGMMPVIGFLLAEYGLPADAMSLKMALFATATCPGGGKSSFWTIIFGGNLDLSISMTFSQTLAALFMMPMWMSTLGKHFTDVHVRIPFARIVDGLIALMIPTSIGMIVTYYRPQYIECIRKWIKRVSWAATTVISIFAIYSNYYIFWLLSWPIVLCGCALPWLGYITAFIVATLLRQQFKDALTIAIETGIKNIDILA